MSNYIAKFVGNYNDRWSNTQERLLTLSSCYYTNNSCPACLFTYPQSTDIITTIKYIYQETIR